jgi:hypothetical protein
MPALEPTSLILVHWPKWWQIHSATLEAINIRLRATSHKLRKALRGAASRTFGAAHACKSKRGSYGKYQIKLYAEP